MRVSPSFVRCIVLSAFLSHLTIGFGAKLEHDWLGGDAYPVALAAVKGGQLFDLAIADALSESASDKTGKRIDYSETNLVLAKGQTFAEGEIRVTSRDIAVTDGVDKQSIYAARFGSRLRANGMEVSLGLIPTRDYTDVVMAAVFSTDDGSYEIAAQSLGCLQANRKARVKLRTPKVYDYRNHLINYTVLFFADQGEVVSNLRKSGTPQVNWMFEDFYGELVAAYQMNNRSTSRGVSVVHRYPIVTDDLKPKEWPSGSSTNFILRIEASGLVSSVVADEALDGDLMRRCEKTLKEWLFLPKLEEGFPVASTVKIPVHW